MSDRPGKELTQSPLSIKRKPPKSGRKELTLPLPLGVEKEVEIDGIGMGVLSDGTPFLSGRGLARLVDMENLHIRTISQEWNDDPQKPRIAGIKKILAGRGIEMPSPHIEFREGNAVRHAFPDTVCLAILEYYAFDAGQPREVALKNYRLLAGRALRDFIYTQVGYDPSNAVPSVWKQFHDRVSLTYNACPPGYFGVFKEIADMIVTLGQAGLRIDASFVPDISVGQAWSKHWDANNFDETYGSRVKYEHSYPSYFPQAASNPQLPWCYPESALGEFRRWFRESYIGDGKFSRYLDGKVKSKELAPSFVQLALVAYSANT